MQQFGGTHRLFIAIVPPKEVRDIVRDTKRLLKKESRNLKFIPVDNLHITLQFIGANVSDISMDEIIEQVEKLSTNYTSPLIDFTELRFGFPGQLKPTVMFWDTNVTPELKQLSSEVHDTIKSLDLFDTKRQKDHAKLIHHMTIARTKRTLSNKHIDEIKTFIKQNVPTELPKFTVSEISLFESFITEKGSSYKLIRSFPLVNTN